MKGPYRPRFLIYRSQQIRSLMPSPAELDWVRPLCCPWFSSVNKFNGFSYCNNLELLSSGGCVLPRATTDKLLRDSAWITTPKRRSVSHARNFEGRSPMKSINLSAYEAKKSRTAHTRTNRHAFICPPGTESGSLCLLHPPARLREALRAVSPASACGSLAPTHPVSGDVRAGRRVLRLRQGSETRLSLPHPKSAPLSSRAEGRLSRFFLGENCSYGCREYHPGSALAALGNFHQRALDTCWKVNI
jgi:hypothetical protein